MNESPCLFCDCRSATNARGLCEKCSAIEGVAELYERRRGWTPEWEQHLIELTRRATARLPLFEPLLHPKVRRR